LKTTFAASATTTFSAAATTTTTTTIIFEQIEQQKFERNHFDVNLFEHYFDGQVYYLPRQNFNVKF
jgi:hypothetical protein